MCRNGVCILSALLVLTACAKGEPGKDTESSWVTSVKDVVVDTCTDAIEALQAPLVDLNVKREEIPKKLQDCADNPYLLPEPPVCFNISREVAELDDLLGADMEPRPLPWNEPEGQDKGYVQRGLEGGRDVAQQQAVGMVSSKVNVIPFRGVVRKVTGAEKHSKELARAYEAGKLRRSFLKGLGSAYGCVLPAHK